LIPGSWSVTIVFSSTHFSASGKLTWSPEEGTLRMNSQNLTREAEQTIDFLLKLAHYVEPLEHVCGRIKMRVPLTHITTVMALLGGVDLENGAKAIPGLKAYEVSPWFRTATIRYDPNVLSFDLWNDFCSIRRDPSVEGSIRDRLLSVFETHPAQ
jgi:hypothetical protein